MRKILFILSVAFTLCLTLCAQTRLVVNTGATANDGTGDSARTAFNKVNTNFATLWAVVYTNGIGATNAFRFSTNAFVTSGTNVSLNHTITITNKLTIDGDLSHDMELQDIAQLTLDATDAGLYGVASLFLDGGITTLRGVTNLQVVTPAVRLGTATDGQVLKLSNADEGTVEFADAIESVGTVSDMLALSGRTGRAVRTLGYLTAGDGGGGSYFWTNSTAGTNAHGGRISNGNGSWVLLHNGEVSIKQFGAKGDAQANNVSIYTAGADDTAAIQSAIDQTIVAGGGNVFIPSGTYRLTSALKIQRRDDTLARLGLTNSDANSTYWNDRPRLKFSGEGAASLLVASGAHGIISIEGKTNYNGYVNRIQNVILEDLNIHHMALGTNTFNVSIFNAGHIALNRVRTRGSSISLKLSALSETQVNKCDFFNSDFGIWMERDADSGRRGDMAGVTILDCQVMGQNTACLAAHYFRDIHIIGGFFGTYQTTAVATIWLTALSPDVCDSIFISNVGIESNPSTAFPSVLIGANGTEGIYSSGLYPFNTYTNTPNGMIGVSMSSCYLGYASSQGAVRVRGSATQVGKGVIIEDCRFDTASTPSIVVIEPEVLPSVVIRYGDNNRPNQMLARTLDQRPYFLTSTIEASAGNLLNGGWRDMSKGGNCWFGSAAPITVITNVGGSFGVQLEPSGTTTTTYVPIFSGASPLPQASNNVIVVDYALLSTSTNTSGLQSAITLQDNNSVSYSLHTLGVLGEYASFTNSYGVWRRYVAQVSPPVGVEITRLSFNNGFDTNSTVTLGYVALYSKIYSGDESSLVPAGASVWAAKFNDGDTQYTPTPTAGNWFGRKWTAGWAVRGAFSGATTYAKGTAVTSSGKVYLATTAISSGGAAPTHSSGIVGGWAFVAVGSASTEQRVVSMTSAGLVTLTALQVGTSPTTINRITHGRATLEGGTVTVASTLVTANSRIFVSHAVAGGTPGWLRATTRVAGSSFTIDSSSGTDTSNVDWMMIEP